MKTFRFKLEKVLKYRTTLENQAKNEYRHAARELDTEREQLQQLHRDREQLMGAFNIGAGHTVDPQNLHMITQYDHQLARLIENQKLNINQKEKIAGEKFDQWNQKRMEAELMQRLKEKKQKEYLRATEKEQQKFNDEMTLARKIREGGARR